MPYDYKKKAAKKAKKAVAKPAGPKMLHKATNGGPGAGTVEIYQTTESVGDKGTWRWRLKANNGKTVADSAEAYVSHAFAIEAARNMLSYSSANTNIVELPQPVPAPQRRPRPVPRPIETPGAPSGLTATPATDKIVLTWNAPTTGGPVQMYHVERREAAGPFQLIVKHSDKLTVTTYEDTKVKPGILYTYRVLAHGVNMQHSPFSNEASALLTISTPDTTPPLVLITAPGDGASVGGTIEVKVRAEDQNGIKQVELRTDGTSRGFSSTPVEGRYRFMLDTKLYNNGQHTLTAIATDNAGNSATSAAVGIHVQNL